MKTISMRRMEVFVAVVDGGSFAAAAYSFGISQPSISAHIQALERDIGGQVFERKRGRKPVLTNLGRSVLLHGRELLAGAADMRAEVIKIQTSTDKRVVLSCQRSLANFALKTPITDFALSRPDIQLVVRVGTQEDIIDDVHNGIADVGCFLENDEIRGLHSEVIGTQKLVLVASPSHQLARRRKVKAREIERHDFVAPPPATRFGRTVSRLLASVGVNNVRISAQATEYQFLRSFVEAGVGIACSLESSVQTDVQRGLVSLIDFDGPELRFQIRQVATIKRPLSPSAQELMQHLRSVPIT